MESDKKEEAKKALVIAERKLSENDYDGAKRFVNKAQRLYPKLDCLKQVSMMINVYVSASDKSNGEADWYGVLGVDPLADDEAVKKKYKKLALLLHPDKNRFNGAEGAFKLVLEAWCLLSDKAKRIAYDQKRKLKQVKQNKSGMKKNPMKKKNPPKYREPTSFSWSEFEAEFEQECEYEPKPEPKPEFSSKRMKFSVFWTACKRCTTYCQLGRDSYLNKAFHCPNCGQEFDASEISPEIINGRPVFRFSPFPPTSDTSSSSTSASDTAKVAEERMKVWVEPELEPEVEPEVVESEVEPELEPKRFYGFYI